MHKKKLAGIAAVAAVILLSPAIAQAYIGPGAGVAVASTTLVIVVSFVLMVFGILFWPFRMLYRVITRKRPPGKAAIRRAVIIGLDGLDPDLVRKLMDEGRLPTLQKIAGKGEFSKLKTTFPAMSPVAWSSFATGVNPAKHGIFDFLTRDRKSYMPDLSSADVGPPRRHLNIGNWQIPVGKPQLKLLRKSKPFWEILGRYRVPCSILRVPITFPPDKFAGTMLSAMCVPDLQGSQGSFTFFTSDPDDAGAAIGGHRVMVTVKDDRIDTALEGPPNPIRKNPEPLKVKMSIHLDRESKTATLSLGREKVKLEQGKYSDWITTVFPMGLGLKMRGMCRVRLLDLDPFRLYVSPVNIDPARPILPISNPYIFSVFLSKLIGRFSTLGLAEDTWALNEHVLDEDAFLEQAWANHDEREAMFFEMLKRTPKGVLTCVFDGTDRIQHMFMRYLDDGHPARKSDDHGDRYKDVIADTYARMDKMVGKVLETVNIDDPETLFIVLSDHGFKTFRRGVNLNSWLHQNGYLVLEEGRTETGEWFAGVDWEKTRAFALGLGGIFLNVKGRESKGCVEPGDAANELADEIAGKLSGLRDSEIDAVGIREVYASHRIYRGPYADDAPDLIVGYAAGWRASWDGVRGIVNDVVFDDNTKAWSGDHCIDPELVPGVLISNRKLSPASEEPVISDLAPTVLELFGVPAPRHMDGKSLARPDKLAA